MPMVIVFNLRRDPLSDVEEAIVRTLTNMPELAINDWEINVVPALVPDGFAGRGDTDQRRAMGTAGAPRGGVAGACDSGGEGLPVGCRCRSKGEGCHQTVRRRRLVRAIRHAAREIRRSIGTVIRARAQGYRGAREEDPDVVDEHVRCLRPSASFSLQCGRRGVVSQQHGGWPALRCPSMRQYVVTTALSRAPPASGGNGQTRFEMPSVEHDLVRVRSPRCVGRQGGTELCFRIALRATDHPDTIRAVRLAACRRLLPTRRTA
jgi:hypothetical protein